MASLPLVNVGVMESDFSKDPCPRMTLDDRQTPLWVVPWKESKVPCSLVPADEQRDSRRS